MNTGFVCDTPSYYGGYLCQVILKSNVECQRNEQDTKSGLDRTTDWKFLYSPYKLCLRGNNNGISHTHLHFVLSCLQVSCEYLEIVEVVRVTRTFF
jgi:hypothetical protein